ncbi:peptide chain release factor N(5)-glutamine methyltransferase [Deinococcus irradiatisoli]|uniref:peptide chain release factor N(5)-glutamine methyltransferase n=1 Tax=Deinococcus irradiatisoli TaxID=2202254 RepID=UPI001FE55EE4|nr:peptide chain release factor N(5)-glutamine methyltransferase [Deinococcus irradiatisoli]
MQGALRDLTAQLRESGVPSPEVDARELVQHALKLGRSGLLTQAGRKLSGEEQRVLGELARRRAVREPLQHLLGEVEWAGLRLKVSPAALVPRFETELLLTLALADLEAVPAPRVLDVGTGTGALALGVKQARPDAQVTASDLSAEALDLARQNAALSGLDVVFVQADLLGSLSGPYDLLLSNPPYLPDADQLQVQPEVGFDPPLALYGGPDGLALARRLAAGAPGVLAPGGVMWLELDPRNVGVLAAELVAQGWAAQVHPDLTGRPRCVSARRV